ncbi:MAG: hypothetical protein ALECFALPRED_011059 [Alectoria fallacina]|uniref:Uncharacterized protein n=1 Tax=Alectoria fallacina TaxID=1903189 RepID=A0A8H3F7T2_9LECA|nr:MAG: hypothetical protein ALECFALPRED_011059 [Alectoria fallacina]
MAFSKRGREPDEAPGHPNKHRRVQKKPQILDPVPRPHSRDDNEEEPGRPGPPSDQVSQVGPRHSSRVKLPPEQTSQRVQPLQRLKIIPPRPPNQSDPNQAGSTDPGSSHSDTSTCYSQYVANYDVEPGVEATGTPEAKDIEYWGSDKRAAEFIRSQSGLEANWVGIRPLGKGGCGMAGLWEMRDDEGQLIKVRIRTRQTSAMILILG